MRMVPVATGTTSFARTIDTTWTRWPLRTVSTTWVPARPRIRREAKSAERSDSDVEPTLTIRSPCTRPARAAGECGNTTTTLSPAGSGTTSIPTPLRCGLDWFRNERYAVGS